jgi:hypothetical protein
MLSRGACCSSAARAFEEVLGTPLSVRERERCPGRGVRLRDDRSARAYPWACSRGPRTAAMKVGRCAAGCASRSTVASRVVASSTKSVGSPRSWSATNQGDGPARELGGVCGALVVASSAARHDQHGPVHAVTTATRHVARAAISAGDGDANYGPVIALAADRPVHRPDVEATRGVAGKGDRASPSGKCGRRESGWRTRGDPCRQHSAADAPMVGSRRPAVPRCR